MYIDINKLDYIEYLEIRNSSLMSDNLHDVGSSFGCAEIGLDLGLIENMFVEIFFQ